MVVIIRFVNEEECLIEHLLGIVYVTDTTSLSLKQEIDKLFSKHSLSMLRLREQGYDGASNMKGELNGLKTLILKENPYVYYIHCFAHQLQLALVATTKDYYQIELYFTNASNVVGALCKRQDLLRDKQAATIIEILEKWELDSGRGLNQETNIKRSGDTRWGSHYNTLLSLILMFGPITDMIYELIYKSNSDQRGVATVLLNTMYSFEFVLILFLMRKILGYTNDLSKTLQGKDQDIVNVIDLVN